MRHDRGPRASLLRRVLRGALRAVLPCVLLATGRAEDPRALDPAKALTQYKIDRWQTEQGLPQNTVQSIVQTRDGYLWIGTLVGLVRFDGVRFTLVAPPALPQLGSRSILGLMEDAEGSLWIGCVGQALRQRKGRFEPVFGEEITAGRAVWAFTQAPDGAIWAATENGLVRWDQGTVRIYRKRDGLPTDRLRCLAFDREGVLWIGTTGGGLVSFSGGRFATFGAAHGFPNDQVRAVHPDPQGGIWVATAGGGLARVQGGRIRTYTTADGLPTNQLSALELDARGTLWIGTWGAGLCRMREGRFDTLSAKGGLSGDQIWSLHADREGSLWAGTWVGGLNRLHNRPFIALGLPEGLSSDNARAVVRARDGAMWIATGGGGVNRIQGGRISPIRARDGLPSDECSSLCEARDGSMWIGTYTAGVARWKAGRIQAFGTAQGLPGTDVRSVYEDRAGRVWAGTTAGLAQLQGGRFVPLEDRGTPIERVVAIHEDRNGALWFGTLGDGLFRFQEGRIQAWTVREGLASNRVLALHEDASGHLWIGTGGGGISRYAEGTMASVRTADGLWDAIAQTVLEDGFGRIWMTCNRGFFFVPRQELEAFLEGRLPKVRSVVFGPSEGLRSTTFAGTQLPAGAFDGEGRLWLPTYKGLVIVDPANLPGSGSPPAVRMEDVTADGQELPGGAPVTLPPGSGPLAIRYTAMTLVDADRVRFRYRMEGLPGDWIDAGTRREAFFPGLPHGHFRFRVAASSDGVAWREAPAPLFVTVQPFFYQTDWFRALAVLAVLGGGALIVRLRTLQLRRRNLEMARIVREKTEELWRANEHLSRLSFLDGLTGLANRRSFDETFEKEWRRAHRFRTPLALVMADVDAFKAYNDALGHPEGDRCLAAVACLFRDSVVRAGDLAARYGGEEFVVLIPGADLETARAFAEKLRQGCEALDLPHPASPAGPRVTLSLGVSACQPTDGLAREALLATADAALYQGKHGGRNRVVALPGPGSPA